jgi:hypothetical protein
MQVLAVGKMSRLLSLTKTSTQSATSSCSGEEADDEIILDDVEPTPTSARGSDDENGEPSGRTRVRSFDTRDHSSMNSRAKDVSVALETEREGSPVFENDADLECAVQNKIKELEKQNLSLKAYLDRGKDDSFSVLTGISLIHRMHEHEKGHAPHGPVRFEESQDDINRLNLATNLATIKSLQMNSLH